MRYERPVIIDFYGRVPAAAHCLYGTTPVSTGTDQGCYSGSDTASGQGHSCFAGGIAHGCTAGAAAMHPANSCQAGGAPSTCIDGSTPTDVCNAGQSFT
jgi:hypothetical protein